MFWKTEADIRRIVREEIAQALADETEFRMKRVYSEDGELVETDYTYTSAPGHIVHFITKTVESKTHFFVAHSRTHKNSEVTWEEARKNGTDIESMDKQVTAETIFSKRPPVPTGFAISSNGLLVPEKHFPK